MNPELAPDSPWCEACQDRHMGVCPPLDEAFDAWFARQTALADLADERGAR